MAWNKIPAQGDPSLTIQIYYLRVNALPSLLSPESVHIFMQLWEAAGSREMSGLRRSRLAGLTFADAIRALAFEEITESRIAVGDWFVHSGVTRYPSQSHRNGQAVITLPNGAIYATVRNDCYVTATALQNMVGDDDISLVVGRLLSPARFDLIAAGYRDPLPSLKGRIVDLVATKSVSELASDLSSIEHLPTIRFDEGDDTSILRYIVRDTLTHFGNSVRDQGAWKHLHDIHRNPVHELQHQGLFRLFANLSFSALGIKVHPGANHGNGATDLTLNLRDATHILEFKKDHDMTSLIRGLVAQLPSYIRAANASSGTYVVMCHQKHPEHVHDILTDALTDMKPCDHSIEIAIIDCRRQLPASQLTS